LAKLTGFRILYPRASREELILADYPGFHNQVPEFADIVRREYLQHPVIFPES